MQGSKMTNCIKNSLQLQSYTNICMKVPIMQQNDSIFAAQGHFRIIIFVIIITIIVTTVIFTIITIVIINI